MSTTDRRSICRCLALACAVFVLPAAGVAASEQSSANAGGNDAYYGNYRVSRDHELGIQRFITDAGESVALIADYQSGVVRLLFPVSETEFVMGPGFAVQSPAELHVRFVKDAQGNVTGISLRSAVGATNFAERVPVAEEAVEIPHGDTRLAGTLFIPPGKGPHPAIILLHGSGPLTRYSFGPYPRFFASLGLAVLIFDKRGTGASTGTRLDASTGAQSPLPAAYYPDDLANDALAVFAFLQRRPEINPKEIGFWGSSEGGMLATQVAARNKDVAFSINSSGFMGPLWETVLYQAGAIPRSHGLSAAQAEEAREFAKLWMRVARTGEGYDQFISQREEIRKANKAWLLCYFSKEYSSLEQMRWDWDHILSFSPLPALGNVTSPVLGVFGELDPLTDASDAASNMRKVLSGAGHGDFTIKIFPNAGHSLGEMPSGSRMAPGVFEMLRSWLLKRVHVAE
ncbi:alpha/beta hydrolase family protein [Steroidobacter cummioxidans]|uniref:alpha/beta hydrolase family protein n=1 Tax=Steroidobacter cummioxidans TaxID=1803913 RepID=UPI00137B2697|nr:alpha/beta hydrolase [Steroidobacter cummioxidans]